MTNVITQTNYSFPGQKSLYKGKVRDVYNINDKYLVMVTSDRISAFDVVLPKGIPYKGQVLNQIAVKFLEATADICPNWKIASPDPSVTIGHFCKPFPLEMIILPHRQLLEDLPEGRPGHLRRTHPRRHDRASALPRTHRHSHHQGHRGAR
jgi:hypothetical protein